MAIGERIWQGPVFQRPCPRRNSRPRCTCPVAVFGQVARRLAAGACCAPTRSCDILSCQFLLVAKWERVLVELLVWVSGSRGTLCTHCVRTRWRVDFPGMGSDIPNRICGNGNLSTRESMVARCPHQLARDRGGLTQAYC